MMVATQRSSLLDELRQQYEAVPVTTKTDEVEGNIVMSGESFSRKPRCVTCWTLSR